MTTITTTPHEREEWHRMAADAYRRGDTFIGHRFSVASACFAQVRTDVFDALQFLYRQWLIVGYTACGSCGRDYLGTLDGYGRCAHCGHSKA